MASQGESILLLIAICILAASVLSAEPLQSANDRSRWATVWSLVERGTYQIDEIDQFTRFRTIDKVRHRTSDDAPWHFYSSKPPLLSTIVAGLYWIERQTIGLGLFQHTTFVTRLLLLIVNWLPMTLALLALRRALRALEASEFTRLFVLSAAAFGSLLNPFLTSLNNHTPAAICALFSILAMVRIQRSLRCQTKLCPLDFVLLGMNAALSTCFELPAALFGVISFLFAVRADVAKTAKFYVPAAIVPLAAFLITNWICTGGLKPFYMYYGTEKYNYVHNGVPSYWMNPQDLDANQEPWPVYLFHCLIGHHGLFSLTPALLLTIPGILLMLKYKARLVSSKGSESSAVSLSDLRPVVIIGGLLSVITLSFYLTRTENYNYGGNSVALRWMLWLTPFWWLMMVPALEYFQSRAKAKIVCSCLLAMSVFTATWSFNRPWKPSWLYVAMETTGAIKYRTPRPPKSGSPQPASNPAASQDNARQAK